VRSLEAVAPATPLAATPPPAGPSASFNSQLQLKSVGE